MDIKAYNEQIITEFRENKGVVGGPFAGGKLLLLHTRGAKSGAQRINPLAYFEDGGDLLVVASNAGAPTNPPWFYNLVAHPAVTVEVGEDSIEVTASMLDEPERSQQYGLIAAASPVFAEYRSKTDRVIPIIRLKEKP